MSQPIGVMYATAGGRYPFLAGVAQALEEHLTKLGYNIVFRMGASGGSLISALRSSNTDFLDWTIGSTTPAIQQSLKIGGSALFKNLWNYVTKTGFLESSDVENLFNITLKNPELTTPTYAVSWCLSAKKPVAFRLTNENWASRVAASCAMPVAMTPLKIKNSELSFAIQEQLGVKNDPNGFSTFMDGGLCPGFPLKLIEEMKQIPVVVVTIDHKVPGQKTDPINIIHRLLAKEMRVKVLENLEEIKNRRPLSLWCVPCPDFINRKYATKFDLGPEDTKSMYEHGYALCRGKLMTQDVSLPPVASIPTPTPIAVEVMVEAANEN